MVEPSMPLHINLRPGDKARTSPLPQLLQTPSGLALLELQGTINLPEHNDSATFTSSESVGGLQTQETPIGRLVFPLYNEKEKDGGAGWMKTVYLYVGKHQRLTGEVKRLPKAMAIIRKQEKENRDGNGDTGMEGHDGAAEELEIVEIVKYKILFSLRPEPVGTLAAAD